MAKYHIIDNFLKEHNFFVTKEISFSCGRDEIKKFLVDDTNKKITFITDTNCCIFNYSELFNFDISEITTSYKQAVAGCLQIRYREDSFLNIKFDNLQTPVYSFPLDKTNLLNNKYQELISTLEYIIRHNKNTK